MKLSMFASPGSYPHKPLADIVSWYERVVQKADELGYSEFWMASHTTSQWARIACPRQFIARLLGKTERIAMGSAVEVLYQQHPITLAAQIGELDQVSGGRLLFGFGAGGPLTDIEAYALDGATIPEMNATAYRMMMESLEIILNCWSEDGPNDYKGHFWNVKRPNAADHAEHYSWHLKPLNSMKGRMAVAGFSARSSSLTIAGERGYIPLSFAVSGEFAKTQWDCLSEGAARTGRTPDRNQWRQAQIVYVAETEKEARQAIRDGFAALFWEKYWGPVFNSTGVMPYLQRKAGLGDKALTADDLIDAGIWCAGTPDQVRDQLLAQNEEFGGFGTVMQLGFDYDGDGADGWFRSMELLAKEVMPAVNAKLSEVATDA